MANRKMPTKTKPEAPIYRLKVTLKSIKPPIWRRIEVRGDISLHRLHRILQVVMGWEDYHLYEFTLDGIEYSEPDPDDPGIVNSTRVKLNQIVTEAKRKFTYTYDFGDDWQHEVLVERVMPAEVGIRYPRCIKGVRACPPEDCGGAWGYSDLLVAIASPEHPEHHRMREWLGGGYDPEDFDLEGVNNLLGRMR